MKLNLLQIHTLQSTVHVFHHSSHRFCDLGCNDKKEQVTDALACGSHTVTQRSIYLVHRDGSLDPRCHRIYPSTHPQEVQRLALLSDGVLCMDPCHFHIAILDGLEEVQK